MAVATASPAFAASPEFTNDPVPPPDGELDLERCGKYAAAGLYFRIASTQGISATAPEDRVTITLPPGFSYLDAPGPGEDSQTRLVHPPSNAAANTPVDVSVPGFTVTGTAGAYLVTANFRGIVATQTVNVKISSGTFRQITRSQGNPTEAATFSLTPNNATVSASSGSIYGDNTANSAGAVAALITTTGALRFWGNLTGVPALAASQNLIWGQVTGQGSNQVDNRVNLGTADNLTRSSVWASAALTTNPNHWGGAAARARTSSNATSDTSGVASGVFSWFRNGSGTGGGGGGNVRLARIGGLPDDADVKYLGAHSGFSYVHAGDGVYVWNSSAHSNNTTSTLAASLVSGTAGIDLVSTYGEFRIASADALSNGGAGIVGRTLVTWASTTTTNGNNTTTNVAPSSATAHTLPVGMGTPTKVVATMSGVVVLDSNNIVWTFNDNKNANAWYAPNVTAVDFSAWGYQTDKRYLGGTLITTAGEVIQFLVDGDPWHSNPVVLANTSERISGIRRVESSDGTYLALKWDGTLYGWNGNLDNSGRAPATTLSGPLSQALVDNTTVDIGVWGFHDAMTASPTLYTGGGYLLTSVACPLPAPS